VILLNGWQPLCGDSDSGSTLSDSRSTFGDLGFLIEADGAPALFFNNCAYEQLHGVLPIEDLAEQLGLYIKNLRYTDGTSVPQVDLVGHSMGGLIARAYLAGKRKTVGSFAPPPVHKVRKLITIATPHFGSFLASSIGVQSPQMMPGSQFLWDLATWNQGQDDVRGVDLLSIAGNAGYRYDIGNADDGVVSLTSASGTFAAAYERTRIVPYCHTKPDSLGGLFMWCSNHNAIAYIDHDSHQSARIVRSFLADTTAWRSIGSTPGQDAVLQTRGGVSLTLKSSYDVYFRDITRVTVEGIASQFEIGPNSTIASVYSDEFVLAGRYNFVMDRVGEASVTGTGTVVSGGSQGILFKYSPVIYSVSSTISTGLPGLTVASGSTIIISGNGFSSSSTQLFANGTPLSISQISDRQITAYLPSGYSGFVNLKVTNSNGQHTIGIMTAPASVPPSISLSKSVFQFSYQQGDAVPQPQTSLLVNVGGGSLAWSASSTASWLSVSPSSGTAPATISISVNPSFLSPGIHNGVITLAAAGASNSPQTLSVTLTVNAAFSALFPQVVVGGSSRTGGTYTTVFTLVNIGGDQLTGNLILTRQDGSPLAAKLDSGAADRTASSMGISLKPGQTTFITAATPIDGDETMYQGWGRIESSGGLLYGVATFQLRLNGGLKTVAGVLSSNPTSRATIPVDDDADAGKFTGYAIVNTGTGDLTVNVRELTADGNLASSLTDVRLGPKQQKTSFLFQDAKAFRRLRGSAVLSAQNGATFGVVALVNAGNMLTTIPVVPQNIQGGLAEATSLTLFPQVAVGGGFKTAFALLNTGNSEAFGTLSMTESGGFPWSMNLLGPDSRIASSMPISLRPGAATFIEALPATQADSPKVGWAQVNNLVGKLDGVATFQLASAGELQAIAGVLSSGLVSAATIPLDDDFNQGQVTGYAIANPGNSAVRIRVVTVNSDGTPVGTLSPVTLNPGQQKASFFFQDPSASPKFRGSAVLIGEGGATFTAVALLQLQGAAGPLYTAIPAIPGKSPKIN
jgi:pimeloyl-ACP methyl ester carboxylesterase